MSGSKLFGGDDAEQRWAGSRSAAMASGSAWRRRSAFAGSGWVIDQTTSGKPPLAVLFDAGLAVGLVLSALREQCRDALGAEVDFDEPGMDEVVRAVRGLGVQVGLEGAAGRADTGEAAPGGGFDGAVDEFDCRPGRLR